MTFHFTVSDQGFMFKLQNGIDDYDNIDCMLIDIDTWADINLAVILNVI